MSKKPTSSAHPKLTPRQARFVELYAGNGTEAARAAGYRGSANTLAQTARGLLTKPHIAAAIRARQEQEDRPRIASRLERQAFWTQVMEDEEEEMSARLKASELLGKSEADFTEKLHLSGDVKLELVHPYGSGGRRG